MSSLQPSDLPFFSSSAQRVLKAVHLICAGSWLGSMAAIAWIQLLAAGADSHERRFGLDLAAYQLHEVLVLVSFVGTLATGILFSLGTHWGVLKHRWIATKWALALLLFGLTLWVQSPAMSGVVALSDADLVEIHGRVQADYRSLSAGLTRVQLLILVGVFAISSIKPWGTRANDILRNRKRWAMSVGGASLVGVTLATVGYLNLQTYRQLTVAHIDVSSHAAGVFRGEADCGFVYGVEAEVRQGKLVLLSATRNRTSHYAQIAEGVLARIVAAQTVDVDAITGATTTSRCLMKATAAALGASPASAVRTQSASSTAVLRK